MSSQRKQQKKGTSLANPSDPRMIVGLNNSTIMTESEQSYEERKEQDQGRNRMGNTKMSDIAAAWPKKTLTSQTKLTSKSISPMREPTRLVVDSPEQGTQTTQKKSKGFNPQVFQFKKGDYNVKQEMFKQSFYSHGEANKHKINQQMVEMTYLAVLRRFKLEKKNGDMPSDFLENEVKWAGQLMRSKKLQRIMAEYNETISAVLDEELKGNTDLIKDWVKYPHRHSQSPKRNQIMLPDLENPVWFPEKAPMSQKLVNVYNKQKQHLAQLASKNQQKKLAEVKIQNKMHKSVAQKVTLTQQVLARMATQRAKTKDPKKDTPVMTPFQEAIHERLQLAKNKVDSMLETNDEWKEQIADIEDDLIKSGIEKAGKNPGNAIKHLLAKWSEEPVRSEQEMARYRNELWVSLENFEKFLKEQEFTMAVELKNAKIQYRTRVDGIRAQTSMRIEALESALIETKLRYRRERERAEMQLAEMESRTMNTYLNNNDDAINRVVKAQENMNNPEFTKLEDHEKLNLLERMCKQLRSSVISLQQEKVGLKKRVAELEHDVNKNSEFNAKAQASARESNEKILYYQQTLYEMLEETGITNMDETKSMLSEEKKLAIKEIYELNNERLRQDREMEKTYIVVDEKKKLQRLEKFVEDFHDTILSVDFRSIFQMQQKVMAAKSQKIQSLTQQFAKLGVIKDTQAQGAPLDETTGLPPKIPVQSHDKTPPNQQNLLGSLHSVPTPQNGGVLNRQMTRKMSKQQTVQPLFGEFHQHVFRVDGKQLNEIQRHFEDLAKPVNEEIQELIQQLEDEENSLGSVSELSQEEGREKKQKAPANKPAGKFMDSSALESKVTRIDPEAKKARLEVLKKKQAKRQEETEKREKKEARAQQKREDKEKAQKKENQNKLKVPPKQSQMEPRKSLLKVTAPEKQTESKTRQPSVESINLSASSVSMSHASSQSARKQSHQEIKKVPTSIEVVKKNKSQNPGTNAGNNGNMSNAPSLKSQKTVRLDKSEEQLRKNKSSRHRVNKQTTNLSVTFKAKDEAEQAEKFAAEGLASDDMNTEPLDRTAEVLEELENKVLQKYQLEIDEVVAAPEQTFKLKAVQNEKIYTSFKEGMGRLLSKEEYKEMHTIGNLPAMIEYLNENIQQNMPGEVGDATQNVQTRKKEIDYERKIPMSDCVAPNLDTEGNLKGFQIRPEIAKVVMWQQGGDMTQIFNTIKTVNFMNRLLFEPQDYSLLTKAKKEVAKREEASMQTMPVEFKDEDPEADPIIRNSEEVKQLVSLLKQHSANLIAKGNESKVRYQIRMQQDQDIQELLGYKLPVQLSTEDDHQLTYIDYLQNLFAQLEQKMITALPKEDLEKLTVSSIVFFGSGNDSPMPIMPPKAPKPVTEEASTQTMPPVKEVKKITSKYSMKALKGGPKPKETQTDDSLIEEYINSKGLNAQIKSATQQLDKSVKMELSKTIATLNEFVDSVKLQNMMTQEEKRMDKKGGNSFFDPHRKSMATQISSNSPFSESPFTPVDQLKSIRAVIESDKVSIQDEIVQMRQKREAHKMIQLRTAEFSARRKETEKKQRTGTLNISIPQKLPKLSNAVNIQSERNYSQSVTSKSGKMPLLQNNLTARGGNPFKQVHVDKKLMLNNDSLQSRMSSPSKFGKHNNLQSTEAKRNPPGLTTVKLDFGYKSPQIDKEATFSALNDSAYDSQSKGQHPFKAATSYQGRLNNTNLTLRESSNGGVRVSTKFGGDNRDLSYGEGPPPMIMLQSVESSEGSEKRNSSAFQNMLIVQTGFKRAGKKVQDTHTKNAVSMLSTPASPKILHTSTGETKGGTGRNRQLISIEPLGQEGATFGRKISTTMMIQKHTEQLDTSHYETKTQN